MVLGRLRGATSQQLGEAARRLGARLHRYQSALAAGLLAAIERGGACSPTPRSTGNGAPPSWTGSPSACGRSRPSSRLLPPCRPVSGRPDPTGPVAAGSGRGALSFAVPALPLVAMGLATTAEPG